MPLSEYERKMLEELEAQLADEDPKFADTFKPEPSAEARSMELSIRDLVLGLLVAIVGIAVLVGGIAIEQVIVGVLGVVVMFAGFWFIASGFRSGPSQGKGTSKASKPDPDAPGKFMDRQNQEWERRRREGR